MNKNFFRIYVFTYEAIKNLKLLQNKILWNKRLKECENNIGISLVHRKKYFEKLKKNIYWQLLFKYIGVKFFLALCKKLYIEISLVYSRSWNKLLHSHHKWRKYRIEIHSESIRTVPIRSDIYIRANANHWIHSNWFWLKVRLRSIRARIDSDWCLGINRIKLDWFLTVFHETRYKTFLGLVRNSSDWLGMNFNPILSPG